MKKQRCYYCGAENVPMQNGLVNGGTIIVLCLPYCAKAEEPCSQCWHERHKHNQYTRCRVETCPCKRFQREETTP